MRRVKRLVKSCPHLIAFAMILILVSQFTSLTSFTKPAIAHAEGEKAVMAFYYTWYWMPNWTSGQMSDAPVSPYVSADDATITRQLNQAQNAGITGFISSWWGNGDNTDINFAKVLNHTAGSNFKMSAYIECGASAFQTTNGLVSNLRILHDKYENSPNWYRYQGKPVVFFWDPGNPARRAGQSTLDFWRNIRAQVDPNYSQIWEVETVDINLLDVFDGIHLFSAADWSSNLAATDAGFRTKVNNYNSQHGTNKIWAAGVEPGYDDTRVPNRSPTHRVARANGQYYSTSWSAAIDSQPDLVTITSFNEWFEGSQIEPSVSYGNLYLDLTKKYVAQYQQTNGNTGTTGSTFADPAFQSVWSSTDQAVANGSAHRSWLWGNAPFAAEQEQYAESPGGSRLVQYFDKSRMERTDPGGNRGSIWYVTNGLLVRELISGNMQYGNNSFRNKGPAQVNIAGDGNDRNAPTYASLSTHLGASGDRSGQSQISTLHRDGSLGNNSPGGSGVYEYYAAQTGHNIPTPIWRYLSSMHNNLGTEWVYACGYPITEAYWVQVTVGGNLKWVLMQAFERRVITYTPSNEAAWQVEMGNVGQHYHVWRYGK